MSNPAKYDFQDAMAGDTVNAKTFSFSKDLSNITGVKVQFRDKVSKTLFLDLSLENGISMNGNDIVINSFKAPRSGDNSVRVYTWGLEITFSNEDVKTYVAGKFKVLPDLIR